MHKNEWIRIERVGSGFRVSTVEGEEESEVFETKKSLLKFIDKHFMEKRETKENPFLAYAQAPSLTEKEPIDQATGLHPLTDKGGER